MKKQIIISVVIAILFIVGLAFIAKPSSQSNQQPEIGSHETSSLLAAEESVFDFGSISMADGDVVHTFVISNTGTESIKIKKMYTSCMCTTASLIYGDITKGPFGMPGHGPMPPVNVSIEPGEEAGIEVIFDPTAHGPAGIGRVERIVYLENDSGPALELNFSATVTP